MISSLLLCERGIFAPQYRPHVLILEAGVVAIALDDALVAPSPARDPFARSAIAAAVTADKREPYLPVGWFWYLGTLVPVLGLVQVGQQAMADRYTYVSLVGLFIAATWGTPFPRTRCSYATVAF